MIKKHICMSFYNDEDYSSWPSIYSHSFGYREYPPNLAIGPNCAEYYTIHYISAGKGTYIINDQSYDITAGDVFICKPGDVIRHQSSKNNPWSMFWYEFSGDVVDALFDNIGITDCVIHQNNTILHDTFTECMQYCSSHSIKSQLILHAFLFKALHGIKMSISPDFKPPSSQAIEIAKIYMETNYNRKITISHVAEHVGFERSYFQHVFKEKAGIPPQEYLNNYRMSKAKELIKRGVPFKEIVEILKLTDTSYFSKVFTKRFGITPNEYRKRVLLIQGGAKNSSDKK